MNYYLKENFRFLYHKGLLFDEEGIVAYEFEASTVMFPRLHLYRFGKEIGQVKKNFTLFLSQYDIDLYGEFSDSLQQELTFFKSRLYLENRGWQIKGDFFAWNYEIVDREGYILCSVHEKLFHLTKHFEIQVYDEDNQDLLLLMVLAIFLFDKEKDSNSAAAAASH